MTNLLFVAFSPALLLISIPLVIFAAFTTTVAFSTLFFRVLIVYAELAAVLIRDQFARLLSTNVALSCRKSIASTNEAKESRGKSRRSSTGSGQSNGGPLTPRILENNVLGIYSSGGIERDFEGVGGWRFPRSDDDDVFWTSMNSRLELPAIVDERKPNHHRSLTLSGLSSAALIPQLSIGFLAKKSTSLYAAGTTSPDEYFSNRATSKSTTSLDTDKIGKALLRRKTSSTSTSSARQG